MALARLTKRILGEHSFSEERVMDKVARGMAEAGERAETGLRPKKGDQYRCEECGMRIQVTADCKSADDHAHFECCGQEMTKL